MMAHFRISDAAAGPAHQATITLIHHVIGSNTWSSDPPGVMPASSGTWSRPILNALALEDAMGKVFQLNGVKYPFDHNTPGDTGTGSKERNGGTIDDSFSWQYIDDK
jgi:hypothetical protein